VQLYDPSCYLCMNVPVALADVTTVKYGTVVAATDEMGTAVGDDDVCADTDAIIAELS
jgi:hypothetical protein